MMRGAAKSYEALSSPFDDVDDDDDPPLRYGATHRSVVNRRLFRRAVVSVNQILFDPVRELGRSRV